MATYSLTASDKPPRDQADLDQLLLFLGGSPQLKQALKASGIVRVKTGVDIYHEVYSVR
jgi:hypothetical protein